MVQIQPLRHVRVALTFLASILLSASVATADPGAGLPELRRPLPPAAFSLADDLAKWPGRLWRNARTLPSWENAQVLSLGGGWAYVASEDWDREVRHEVAENRRRMGDFNDFFSASGHPMLHIGAATLLYAGSIFRQNRHWHEFSLDLIDTLVLTDLSNQGLKYVFNSDRPNGDPFGFPSGHTASSFAFASVVESHFGLLPGLVAYGLAGTVGWHRIDDQKHELSDVLAGAAIGYVVGKSVTGNGFFPSEKIRIIPYSDPYGGGAGIGIAFRF